MGRSSMKSSELACNQSGQADYLIQEFTLSCYKCVFCVFGPSYSDKRRTDFILNVR